MFEEYFVALLLQAAEMDGPTGEFGDGLLDLIARSSFINKSVLIILLLFSIASWAIILFKLREFRRVEAQTSTFVEIFRKSSKFSEVQSVCKSLANSPLSGVFQAGYVELNAQLRNTDSQQSIDSGAVRPVLCDRKKNEMGTFSAPGRHSV